MKASLIVIALFLLPASIAFGQGRGLWVAPQGSIGLGKLTNFSASGADPYFSLNFSTGADVYYMFTKNIGAGTGLGFSGYASEWKAPYNGVDAKYIFGHKNLDVPLFVRYNSDARYGFFAQGGVITSFLVDGVEEVLSDENDTELLKVDGDEASKKFQSVSVFPYVHFGADIRCGNRVKISIGPYVQYQLNNDFTEATTLKGHYLIVGGKIALGILAFRGE